MNDISYIGKIPERVRRKATGPEFSMAASCINEEEGTLSGYSVPFYIDRWRLLFCISRVLGYACIEKGRKNGKKKQKENDFRDPDLWDDGSIIFRLRRIEGKGKRKRSCRYDHCLFMEQCSV